KLDKGPKKIHTVYREMATRNKRNADVELDEIMLKKTCKTIVHSADLETITIKQVRRDAEVKLGLTAKFLDKQPWKDLIHEFVTEAIEKSKSEDVSVVYSSRSKSVKVEESKDDNIVEFVEDGGSVMALENKVARESDQGLNKSRTKDFRNDKLASNSMEEDSENDINSESKRSSDAEISDTEYEIVKRKRKEKSTTTKRTIYNIKDSHSELEDDPPKKRKTKKAKSAPTVLSNNDDETDDPPKKRKTKKEKSAPTVS
ncbi:18890_t:CDS:2, partial [Gigaspora rosea]